MKGVKELEQERNETLDAELRDFTLIRQTDVDPMVSTAVLVKEFNDEVEGWVVLKDGADLG
jgi:hypothetical protein